jgi:ribose-phosphate pyrophosphokinase
MQNFKLISTRSNKILAEKVAKKLNARLTKIHVKDFPDSEIYVEIKENIRREEIFLIAGFSTDSNKNNDILELMLIIDAIRRSNPSKINVIFPYYPYARQDRRTNRSPISGKVIANMLCHTGINSVICMDLHSLQTQGFFNNNVVCEHISALKTMRDSIVDAIVPSAWDVVVSSDVGGTSRARYFSNLLDLPIAIIDKRRPEPGISKVMNVIGNVVDKKCVIVDDMIDGGGTLVGAVEALEKSGSKSVDAISIHGVFSGKAIQRIEDSNIGKVYISDSIEQVKDLPDKIVVVGIEDLLSETIRRFYNGESLKALVS